MTEHLGGLGPQDMLQQLQRMRCNELVLRHAQASSMRIRAALSSFCNNNSQACELRNTHSHIVRYSRGPLYLGERRISIAVP